jgi:hypothetical protein
MDHGSWCATRISCHPHRDAEQALATDRNQRISHRHLDAGSVVARPLKRVVEHRFLEGKHE